MYLRFLSLMVSAIQNSISRHNVHQYLEFFKLIRENIKNGTLGKYKEKIALKFESNKIVESNIVQVEQSRIVHA